MNPQKRQFLVAVGGLFGAGLFHSLLPPGDLWIRAMITSGSAVAISGFLLLILPGRSTP